MSGTPAPADGRSPLLRVRELLPGLHGARRRVAEIVVSNAGTVGRASITSVAAMAETSAATVSRVARSLGYESYPALRAAIAEESGRVAQAAWEDDIGPEIGPDDTPAHVLNAISQSITMAMRDAVGSIDLVRLERIAFAISAASRVLIHGDWGDSVPARELQMRLARVGTPATFQEGIQASLAEAALLASGDVAIVFSRAGEGVGLKQILDRAARAGAVTVVFTSDPAAELAAVADECVYAGTPVGPYWTDYLAGRAGDSLAASVLWVLVVQRMESPAFTLSDSPDGLSPG